MKKKAVEKTKPIRTRKKGLSATVQMVQDILVLNIYCDKEFLGRYCMNTETYEFMQWNAETEQWGYGKLVAACGYETWYHSYCNLERELKFNHPKEEKLVKEKLNATGYYAKCSAVALIHYREDEYTNEKRERTEHNRVERVRNMMAKVPPLPSDVRNWIYEKATGAADFVFYDKAGEQWQCTHCGKSYKEQLLHRTDGEKKIRHNDMVICPKCQKVIQAKKRTQKQEKMVHLLVLQPMDDRNSVARHFDVTILWSDGKKSIVLNEAVRITINKLAHNPKMACDIYYNQYSTKGVYVGGSTWDYEYGCFDNKSNPAQRKIFAEYLYEERIEEALEDTVYQAWTRVFIQLSAAGRELEYNRLMATQEDEKLIQTVECLFKGRFHRLLRETAEKVSLYSCEYCGPLRKRGSTIEEVFGIKDRQKINRIRDLDGGNDVLDWMRWSDETGEKISQDALCWLTQCGINRKDIAFIKDRMSVQQIMNYVKRQQAEGYKGKSASRVLDQWNDYLQMCQKLKKHVDDEMVYRPRELKRRHDEAVAEIALRESAVKADEYRNRFPGAEDVLREIKPKYEYASDEYIVTVPEQLVEIVAEGRALHHCAGSSDRYFDRILQRETYICFLRKAAEPNVPYYTIEIEPGGTIRQHRGYLDEEPEIEKIKPFLREWQQAVKKRLNEKDREYAQISAVKRQENIEELKAKNNTRVLNGLMEDFMEAM